MSPAATRRRARRGLLVLLDGLVIAGLAAVIAARSDGTAVADLVAASLGVLSTWLATPGVGILEAIGYAGLTVAILGPLWYWMIQGVVGPVSLKSLLRSVDSRDENFEFPEDAATVDRQDERGQISDGGDVFQTVLADELQSSRPDWTEALFGESSPPTKAVPEGDFLRGGSSGVDPEETGHRRRSLRATFGPPEDGDASRSVDIRDSPGESTADQEPSETIVKASHEAETAESRSEETELDGALLDAFGADQTESADDPADTETDAEESTDSEPADPLERLGEQLSDSRAQLGTVEERLTEATAPNAVETAKGTLADRTSAANDTLSHLEDELPTRNLRMAEAIAELRTDQATLESAFESISQGF